MNQKLAVITGTSSGIGQALAEQLLADGWVVFGLARREVKHANPAYRHIQADLADPAVASSVVAPRVEAELAFGEFSRLVLVNNAASTGQLRHYGNLSAADTFRDTAINLAAPIALMDMILRVAPERAALRVVNISTGLATYPLPGAVEYCASKAGLLMAGQVMASELEGDGRDNAAVLSYEPGVVDTNMQETLRGQDQASFSSQGMFNAFHAEGRLVAAEDVLDPIVDFLNNDQANGFIQVRYNA